MHVMITSCQYVSMGFLHVFKWMSHDSVCVFFPYDGSLWVLTKVGQQALISSWCTSHNNEGDDNFFLNDWYYPLPFSLPLSQSLFVSVSLPPSLPPSFPHAVIMVNKTQCKHKLVYILWPRCWFLVQTGLRQIGQERRKSKKAVRDERGDQPCPLYKSQDKPHEICQAQRDYTSVYWYQPNNKGKNVHISSFWMKNSVGGNEAGQRRARISTLKISHYSPEQRRESPGLCGQWSGLCSAPDWMALYTQCFVQWHVGAGSCHH